MIVTWTITEGANWDWTFSTETTFEGEGWSYADSASLVMVLDPLDGTDVETFTFTRTRTATFYTSTLSEVETSIRTTTTSFNEGANIFAETTSASVNTGNGQIVVFSLPTTQTVTTHSAITSTVLSTKSAGTYLEPFPPPVSAFLVGTIESNWVWGNGGYQAYVPTVVAWSSAAGYTHPLAQSTDTATSLPSAASMAFSGQITLLPASGVYNLVIVDENEYEDPDYGPTSEIYQSEAITWTEQAYTESVLTTLADGLPIGEITQSTRAVVQQVATTITESAIFESIRYFQSTGTASGLITSSVPSWWDSTLTIAATYVDVTATRSGKSITTKLTSSSYSSTVSLRDDDSPGQLPLEKVANKKRGELQFGNYSHFYTQNAGAALNTTQEGRAVISDAGQSFSLPPQPFSTALLQRGVTAPLPFQTRSRASSNSTISWSLGFTALTITTLSTNSTTSGSATSSYALSAAGPTIWASTSRFIDESTDFTAAGGRYATNSAFVGGGLFTATANGSEFTGSVVSVGTNASAFQPLPHFVPVLGEPSVATFAPALHVVGGAFGLSSIGFPLTA